MKAIIAAPQGAQLADLPMLQPGPHELLVRVKTARLNRADLAGLTAKDDKVTGKDFANTFKTAAIGASVVHLGRLGGAGGEFDFQLYKLPRISYIGVTFRTHSELEFRALNARMLADLGDASAARMLRFPIDRRFAFAQVGEALARMTSNQHFGKIILTL